MKYLLVSLLVLVFAAGEALARHCQTNQAGPEEPAIKAYQAAS